MTTTHNINPNTVPQHVAIIMDGNGRWAVAQGMDRSAGHVEGVKTVHRITEIAGQIGVKYLTLYTFSTENWNRPQTEVDLLMHLIVSVIEEETPGLIKNNVRLSIIGDMSRVPQETSDRLYKCIDDTAHCTGLNLILAISYSSRWEITEAARKIAQQAVNGIINPADISAETISKNLATANIPDPDLLIRTGGDLRISNFLLWQIAYSEIYVTDTYWPDFSNDDFIKAINVYASRQRRFGMTGEQITNINSSTK
jgi:undecaprenyl diphosphate synthase